MNVRLIRSLGLVCAITTGAALLGGCNEEAPPPQATLRPVKSITVDRGTTAIRERVFSGSAQSAEEVALSFKVSGTVAEIPVAVGDLLKKGALIATLDRDLFDVELDQALAQQAQAKASRRNTEAEYQRVRMLYANDNASRNELDTALANAESAKASHNVAIQGVRLARLNHDYTHLSVAADCSVAELAVEVNENVSAGQTVAQVNCGADWEVVISVPESLIAAFDDGMDGLVRFPSVPGKSFRGVVTEVGVGTGGGQTFPVTLSLETLPQDIRSNLAAEVTLQLSAPADSGPANDSANRLHLPPTAVAKDELGTFVYVVQSTEEPGAAVLERRTVEVGEISELGIEVLSGLQTGERVVTAGQIHARDGMLVRNP